MTNVIHISRAYREKACVVALHCSLGSGRQWKTLADELGREHPFFAPDISGYGANGCALDLPLTLAEEVWRAAEPGETFEAAGLQRVVQRRAPVYDKSQDGHYNLISALHKAVRGSDPDAAL